MRHQHIQPHAPKFAGLVSKQPRGLRVREDNVTGGVDDENAVRDRFENDAKFALDQLRIAQHARSRQIMSGVPQRRPIGTLTGCDSQGNEHR
jgi:hypothetical protein